MAVAAAERMILWRKPGAHRYHWLRLCSGGAGVRSRRATLTRAEFERADRAADFCRCVPQEFRVGGHPQSMRVK